MDLSIIIVSWKVKDLLRKNLSALLTNSQNIRLEIFVVDNNSGDGTVEMISRDFPRVKLIANGLNAGFAKANNQAIKQSKGKYILLLNPDMKVLPGTLKGMVRWMEEHQEAGVAGCRLITEGGQTIPHVRRFPALADQLAIALKLPHLFPGILNTYLRANFDYNCEAEADSIRGSFFMIRSEALEKVGLLDEQFFIWFEEVDYCQRVKRAGWKVMYTPAAQCVDHVGQSFKSVKRGAAQKYFRDSMLKYFKKWRPGWQVRLLALAWPIGRLIAFISEKINFRSTVKT